MGEKERNAGALYRAPQKYQKGCKSWQGSIKIYSPLDAGNKCWSTGMFVEENFFFMHPEVKEDDDEEEKNFADQRLVFLVLLLSLALLWVSI